MDRLQSLKDSFKNDSWFYDVGLDTFNRPVLYVHLLNKDIINYIREKDNSNDFLIHYAAYAKININNYITIIENKAESNVDDLDLNYLVDEVNYLQSVCKRSILQDIFYEVHDGKNAVTNLSSAFPEVKDSISDLYQIYGYDLLYEELEK
jgi:hypothetical protein